MLEVGQRPKLTFHGVGNVHEISNLPIIDSNIQEQISLACDETRAANIRNTALTEDGTGYNFNNVCFVKLSAPNVTGVQYQRSLTGCVDEWQKDSVTGEVVITVIEEQADTDTPDSLNVEDSVGKKFSFRFVQSGIRGSTLEVALTGLTLKNYQHTEVQGKAGQDLTFIYAGHADITLR
ncbi:MAG: hypothetical protein KAG66_18845, partial [Methylococcales bacterium]|nr:hypothetical protein [Methylococcales bacterium]